MPRAPSTLTVACFYRLIYRLSRGRAAPAYIPAYAPAFAPAYIPAYAPAFARPGAKAQPRAAGPPAAMAGCLEEHCVDLKVHMARDILVRDVEALRASVSIGARWDTERAGLLLGSRGGASRLLWLSHALAQPTPPAALLARHAHAALAQDRGVYFAHRAHDAQHNVIHLSFVHSRPMSGEDLAGLLQLLCEAWGARPSVIFNRHAAAPEGWGHLPADSPEDVLDYYQFDLASAARIHTAGGDARLFACWHCAERKAWEHFAQHAWIDGFDKTLAGLVYSGGLACCTACVRSVCVRPYAPLDAPGVAALPPPAPPLPPPPPP